MTSIYRPLGGSGTGFGAKSGQWSAPSAGQAEQPKQQPQGKADYSAYAPKPGAAQPKQPQSQGTPYSHMYAAGTSPEYAAQHPDTMPYMPYGDVTLGAAAKGMGEPPHAAGGLRMAPDTPEWRADQDRQRKEYWDNERAWESAGKPGYTPQRDPRANAESEQAARREWDRRRGGGATGTGDKRPGFDASDPSNFYDKNGNWTLMDSPDPRLSQSQPQDYYRGPGVYYGEDLGPGNRPQKQPPNTAFTTYFNDAPSFGPQPTRTTPAQSFVGQGYGFSTPLGQDGMTPAGDPTFLGYGNQGNLAYMPEDQRPAPFVQQYQGFDGSVSDTPNYNQRDAFIQRLNDMTSDAITSQRGGPIQYDFPSLWGQAGNMVQNGWANPLAGLFG